MHESLAAGDKTERRMARRKSRINFPDRKISETFLEFAEPLLIPLGPRATQHELTQALQLAFIVWNAVVYETVNRDTRYLTMLRDLTAGQPEVVSLVNHMIERKRRLFGNDHRVVGNFKLTIQADELNLRVEARDPTVRSR
jgi:hypothetical protein